MKLLKGSDLVEYISERQAKQVRSLTQSRGIVPTLAIISTNPNNKPSQTYIKLKQKRAQELGIKTRLVQISEDKLEEVLEELNQDDSVYGIILQLPLEDPTQTEHLTGLIHPQKDVDGLNLQSELTPATPGAILWLLAGYNIDLKDKSVLIVGQGKLVGLPLKKFLEEDGVEVKALDLKNSPENLAESLQQADIIISATGSPNLVQTKNLRDGQVVIDAGTSELNGSLAGDVSPEVYSSGLDLKITPQQGGVGPLTVAYLFENLLQLIDKYHF